MSHLLDFDSDERRVDRQLKVTPAADATLRQREVRPLRVRLRFCSVLEVLATGFHYAIVRIVPVVSELLNLTENVSPVRSVSAEP